MKKFLSLLLLSFILSGFAQSKDKIKGNRKVLTRVYEVPSFHKLEANGDLRIKIEKTPDTVKIQLRADENLQDVLGYSVHDGVLHLGITKEIVRKKAFEITLFVNENFDELSLSEYAKVKNENLLKLKKLHMELKDRAQADLYLKVKDTVGADISGNALWKGEVHARAIRIHTYGSGEVQAHLFAKNLKAVMTGHGKIYMRGSIRNLELKAKDKAHFNAKKGDITKDVNVMAKDKSTIYLHGKGAGNVVIFLSGKSELHLSGDFAEFALKKFRNQATLFRDE